MPDRARLVSVVIPAMNAAAVIEDQLGALSRQEYSGPWEAVVADNGSTDGTSDVVRKWAERIPNLRVIEAFSHKTVSHARNAGVRASAGDFILLCDADDRVSPHWITAMMRAAARYDAVGGALDVEAINSATVIESRPRLFQNGLEVHFELMPYALGANCGFSRELFEQVGGFDETYVGGGDEIDFFWRAQLLGFRLGFASDAAVAYRYRSGARAVWRQFYRYGRADPQLYRRYRSEGMSRPPVARSVARLSYLIVRAPLQMVPATRSRDWTWKVAWHVGHVVGSIRNRVIFI